MLIHVELVEPVGARGEVRESLWSVHYSHRPTSRPRLTVNNTYQKVAHLVTTVPHLIAIRKRQIVRSTISSPFHFDKKKRFIFYFLIHISYRFVERKHINSLVTLLFNDSLDLSFKNHAKKYNLEFFIIKICRKPEWYRSCKQLRDHRDFCAKWWKTKIFIGFYRYKIVEGERGVCISFKGWCCLKSSVLHEIKTSFSEHKNALNKRG